MKSFQTGFIDRQPISQSLLRTVRLIGEYKGKQGLYKEQAPQVLETLQQTAIIQSTESSNRIEGVIAPPKRIRELVARKTSPVNRSEQEIAGYRDVLNTVHSNYEYIPFTPNVILQLHRDLYQFVAGEGGQWKRFDNEIAEIRPDGTKTVRFQPVSALATSDAMQTLHERFNRLWESEEFEPLLLIPSYVLDFLCIHPFRDGNGRMARLLTLLLLYKAGYEVGRYISLEKLVEDHREGYYDTLYQSSQGWHEGKQTMLPWWEYFLGVMLLTAYRDFEERVGCIISARGVKRDIVFDVVARLPHRFQYGDVARACPDVSRPTISRALARLRDSGKIHCIKFGRDALWEKRDHIPPS